MALTIRAIIRANKFAGNNHQWDARMAIGIGTLDYETDLLSTSDGEAYRLSGKCLDSIGKGRLCIKTPWEDVNKELTVSTLFADDIVTGWTQSQSRIIFEKLLKNNSQEESAIYSCFQTDGQQVLEGSQRCLDFCICQKI